MEVKQTNVQSGINIASASNNYDNTSSAKTSNLKAQQTELEELKEKQDIEEQKKKLNELAQQLNKELNPLNTNVTFSFNEDIEGLYVTVSERDTNRVIRKIPSDEAMELMAKMKEVVGMIFDKQA
ncbi:MULTISPECIES: FlaG family protein [Helicobacter]|uniref:FlaG family protein n=1 Tax=Helicobacter ibis TaxID=2962633 RepID=A0ABT4VDM8_9HELI|nr:MULTISPECIES: FlaG family protein [Helicobacter]MDA3967810.1 FlaG family protein [Helicobacter sp. WB40]MDA3968712.1 FlaG family protein [Helicobacter ibis]